MGTPLQVADFFNDDWVCSIIYFLCGALGGIVFVLALLFTLKSVMYFTLLKPVISVSDSTLVYINGLAVWKRGVGILSNSLDEYTLTSVPNYLKFLKNVIVLSFYA